MRRVAFLVAFLALVSSLTQWARAYENVGEAWRSPFGTPVSVSVDSTDGSCWAATGSSVMHLAAGATILSQSSGFWTPGGVAANPSDGSCWVADSQNHQVVHLAADGSEVWRGGTSLLRPAAIAVNPVDGSCWVADEYADVILHLDQYGTESWRGSGFSNPLSVSVDPGDGSCWAALEGSSQVVHLDADGGEIKRVSGFSSPLGVAVDASNHSVWVADSHNNEVVHLDADGGEIKRVSGFYRPAAVSVDPTNGSCWVADYSHGQVVHLKSDGAELWRGWDSTVASVSVNPTDHSCWIADIGVAQIAHLSSAGAELWSGGEFLDPRSVSANSSDGSCWIADSGNAEIVHIAADGTELWRGENVSPATVSANPTDGSCWVADGGGTEVIHLAEDGSGAPRIGDFLFPSSVSANPTDGSCWVADAGHGEVVHLSEGGTELWRGGAGISPRFVSVSSTNGSCWVGGGARAVLLSAAGVTLAQSPVFHETAVVSTNPTDESCWVAVLNGLGGPTDEVAHIAADGTLLWRGGKLCGEASVSVNPTDGSCWITDLNCNQVVHVAADGTELSRSDGFSYPVSVSVDAADGSCWVADSDTSQIVRLVLLKPRADFDAVPRAGPTPLMVSFLDKTVGNPTAWLWEFGDGGTSAEQNPQHQYVADGSYAVSLTATNEFGSDAVTKMGFIVVITPMPTADFSATPTTGQEPLKVEFLDESTGYPASWLWNFGDGETSTGHNPTHIYAAEGVYTVSLTVTNVTGSNTKMKVGHITVTPPPPEADFTGSPTRGVAPQPVTSTDASTRGPTSWLWDFGDEGTSTEQNPSVEFITPGTHTVSLTASNQYGSDTKTKVKYILVTFPDVPLDYWAMEQVISCVDARVAAGYPDGTYRPEVPITRDQMAVYISRALAGGDGEVPADAGAPFFPDVPEDYWAYRYIQYAKTQDIVQGYPDGNYQPLVGLDRGQMAVFIARSIATPTGDAGLVGYTPTESDTFPDVASDFWAFMYIGFIKSKGVTQGYPDGMYHPEYVCTRDQMAVYVSRAFALPL